MRPWCRWIVVTLVACLILSGCGADGGTREPSAAPTTTPPASPEAALGGVGEIVWTAGVDPETQAPVDAMAALPNDAPQVIAALPVEMLPAGTVLQAHWSIDGEPLPALDSDPVTVEHGLAGAWVTWTLQWAGNQPWPIGRLGIAVEIDGGDGPTADIPIVRPNA